MYTLAHHTTPDKRKNYYDLAKYLSNAAKYSSEESKEIEYSKIANMRKLASATNRIYSKNFIVQLAALAIFLSARIAESHEMKKQKEIARNIKNNINQQILPTVDKEIKQILQNKGYVFVESQNKNYQAPDRSKLGNKYESGKKYTPGDYKQKNHKTDTSINFDKNKGIGK
jgi:hypothetical protein